MKPAHNVPLTPMERAEKIVLECPDGQEAVSFIAEQIKEACAEVLEEAVKIVEKYDVSGGLSAGYTKYLANQIRALNTGGCYTGLVDCKIRGAHDHGENDSTKEEKS